MAITQEFGAIPRDLIDYKISVTEKSVNDYKVVDKGDFIISLRSFQGGIEYSNYKGICSPAYIILKPKTQIDHQFYKFYLKTNGYITLLTRKLEGIRDGKMISYKYFSEIQLPVPSISEQEKISNFLNLLQSKIDTQKKTIENFKTQMQGLQQRLFQQKIRFSDVSSLWEYKNGGDLFESVSSKNHNSDLPILAITQEQGAIPRELIEYQITVTDKSVENYKVVEIGDFIISLRSFQGGIEYSNYKGICSPAYIILKNKIEIIPTFYKYYFKTSEYIKLLNKKLEGIRDGKMISYKYFSEILLPVPSLKEQIKIADFLSKISDKIETEKRILELLEQQKKYFLQNLFV